MKKLLLTLWLFALPLPAFAQGGGYLLNPGDVLEVSVWKEEGMTREVLVLPDGTISFPLAGHLKASNLTAAEVQKALTERLQQYIPEPVVTVTVQEVSGNKIYVIGQVRRPGEFPAGHMIDVMQALSLAGGLTAFGDENDIKVLRRQGDRQISFPFDYSAVKKGSKLEMNIILQSGDVVVVPD
jgi:polysaccharide export outer membrane protein